MVSSKIKSGSLDRFRVIPRHGSLQLPVSQVGVVVDVGAEVVGCAHTSGLSMGHFSNRDGGRGDCFVSLLKATAGNPCDLLIFPRFNTKSRYFIPSLFLETMSNQTNRPSSTPPPANRNDYGSDSDDSLDPLFAHNVTAAISEVHGGPRPSLTPATNRINQSLFGQKRDSDGKADSNLRAADGCSSPLKKKAAPLQSRTITQSQDNDDSPGGAAIHSTSQHDDISVIQPTPAAASVPAGVTPSPEAALAEALASVAVSPNTKKQRKQEEAERKKREQRRIQRAKKVQLNNDFFQYLRPSTFDKDLFGVGAADVYAEEEIAAFDTKYQQQLVFNFDQKRRSKKQATSGGRASRSQEQMDLDTNLAAFNMETTDRRELSRYVLEDLLSCQLGDRFLMLIKKSKSEDFADKPEMAAVAQQTRGIGGELCKISGELYYCLKATISHAPLHEELRLGMTRGQFKDKFFDDSGGFVVCFDDTDVTLTFSWQQLLEDPMSVMFFGRPFATTRPFDKLFKGKNKEQYAHHVFRQFSAEYYGDARMSAQLYAAYLKCLYGIMAATVKRLQNERDQALDKATFNTPQCKLFCKIFDQLCHNSFIFCMTDWNDYTQPIVHPNDFTIKRMGGNR